MELIGRWIDSYRILPQARFIDILPQAHGCVFTVAVAEKRLRFFSYDLRDVARYYRRYVNVMEHWQAVLPGRVHFMQYERLVEDTESEIRGMLDYCGLPFEEGCLRFWEVDRHCDTGRGTGAPSIYREAHWSNGVTLNPGSARWRSFAETMESERQMIDALDQSLSSSAAAIQAGHSPSVMYGCFDPRCNGKLQTGDQRAA